MPNHLSNQNVRVVLLGASNLTRSISTVMHCAQCSHEPPLETLIAYGHGRSYGNWSCVLGRSLPGIIECGLWDALTASMRGRSYDTPTYALLTDIGNDILYDATPEQISDWIAECVERLCAVDARIALSQLPVARLRRVTPRAFRIARSIMFPGSRLTYDAALRRIEELDSRLRVLADQRDLVILEHEPEWYGLDPIHIRMRSWPEAWDRFTGPWRDAAGGKVSPSRSFRRWLRLRRAMPESWRLCGREMFTPQPAIVLNDGSTFAFY